MKKLVIFGSGGFAREVRQVVEDINARESTIELLGFLDSDAGKAGTLIHGLPVLGPVSWLDQPGNADVHLVIAIGNTAAKRRVARDLVQRGHGRFLTLVHPTAWIGARVQLGAGTIVCAGTLITTDITIGEHVIVNIGSTIGHDAVLDDYVTVAPNVSISGAVRVGEGADVGTGASVIQGVTLHPWSTVGAGAVLVGDVAANATAVGVPAKTIKIRPEGWHMENNS